ncbi:DUF1349 domain-containing protein [Anoxybacterium hadale]|uniref:DUF1349 domain-containing protein n=1 Tax=Anoxybacterium hadale TaxID=3408580 RepID=A0ACD1A6A9_9FIRM|nr:DUF1349 domain-containing protein [Clostridiales bacterium]
MVKKVISIFLVVAMMMTMMIQPVFATYQPELPSLYQTFNKYFMFGSFQGMSSFFGSNADQRNMLQHHYNSWSPSNEFKPSNLLNLSTAASNYTTVYNEVNADGVIDEAESARLYAANTTLVLGSTSSQLSFLKQVQDLNKTRGPEDQVKVKAHTLFWHNLGQQPEAFFRVGFSNSNGWASKEVMLDRIDSYIKLVFERFEPYKDVLYSWDVVNESIDDFSGFIRNENDYQEGRWGRIFKRPDITDKDARLYEEAVWVRQAFKSAAKYNNQYNLGLTLVYNDFFDADKDYEPKLSATIKMLEPIYEQMKKDGVTFVVGMQNRNATSLDLDVFKDMYNRFSAVCDEFQTTESDTRSDLVANPNYSRDVLPYYLPDGTKNPEWTYTKWQNTPNAHVALVRNGWTAAMGNNTAIMKEQADWQADQFDFLLENSKGNGGKLAMYAFDGLTDSQTFNSNKGAHIFMAGDNAGNTDYTAKMSYYAMIGSVARFELKKQLQNLPDDSSMDIYTPDSWSRYTAAKQAASDILNVRIYDLNAVNNVKNAASALTAAVEELTDLSVSLSDIKVNGTSLTGFAPGTRVYNAAIPVGVLPEVTATAADPAAKIAIVQAEGLPGKATINVTSSDDSKHNTYTINFNVDTTLSSLKVDGIDVSGFSPNTFTYNLVVPYGSKPEVTATSSDPGVLVNISQVDGVPGQAIIDVSQASVKTTYTINFNVDSSLKSLKVNGVTVSGFTSGIYTYNVYVPEGVSPVTVAVPNDLNAPISTVQADTVPGKAVITVGTGSAQLVYTVNFSNSASSSDEFSKAALNTSLWHWVNEDPSTWSLTSNPGYMTISPRAGDIYGSGSTDAKNILLQNAPGDWTIETKLQCSVRPHAAYQQGGIIAYQDMDNYIKLDWESTSSTNTIIQVCREVGGSATSSNVNGSVVGSDNTLWLRMVKSGNVYTTYYSTNGTNFTQLGTSYTLNFKNVQAGLIAINGSGTNTDLDVKFDYFHSSANIFVPLPADKEALTSLIDQAKALNELHYTIETWANLQTALNDAIAKKDDPAASQTDVNTAATNLQAAIGALVHRAAATSLTGSDRVQPQSSFVVGIGLNNISQDVYAEDISLSFDPEVFEYDTVTSENPNISILTKEPSATGTLRIVAANIGGVKADVESLINVGFKVKAGVKDVTSSISITKAKLGIMPEGTVVQPLLASKTITVEAAQTVDKSALIAAINAAQEAYDNAAVGNDPGQYPAAAKEAFLTAINAANLVYANPDATQAEVNREVEALAAARTIFDGSVIPQPDTDKTELKAAIDDAQALYDRAVVGTADGNYRQADKNVFQLAIAAAKEVFDNSGASQEAIDNATSTLKSAKAAFEASVITATTGDLNNSATIDVGDLAIIAYYYGAKLGDENWASAKIADINNDGKVDIEDLAFVALRMLD